MMGEATAEIKAGGEVTRELFPDRKVGEEPVEYWQRAVEELLNKKERIEAARILGGIIGSKERNEGTDPLTELPNKRTVDQMVNQYVELSNQLEVPFALIFVDIDNFKKWNDLSGQERGNEMIIKIAAIHQRLDQQLGLSGGVLGRYGGEEFIWLLPVLDQRSASKLAESARQAVETELKGQLTCSYGVYAHPAETAGQIRREDAIEKANVAVTIAKGKVPEGSKYAAEKPKNRVIVWDETMPAKVEQLQEQI